jgi:hypothetical protein
MSEIRVRETLGVIAYCARVLVVAVKYHNFILFAGLFIITSRYGGSVFMRPVLATLQ